MIQLPICLLRSGLKHPIALLTLFSMPHNLCVTISAKEIKLAQCYLCLLGTQFWRLSTAFRSTIWFVLFQLNLNLHHITLSSMYNRQTDVNFPIKRELAFSSFIKLFTFGKLWSYFVSALSNLKLSPGSLTAENAATTHIKFNSIGAISENSAWSSMWTMTKIEALRVTSWHEQCHFYSGPRGLLCA